MKNIYKLVKITMLCGVLVSKSKNVYVLIQFFPILYTVQ